ncbi:hypothetical protein DICPUDRAFT_98229 [Dictyostelium purpureum]|uniref:Rho-GAP domain-containing protein n=1 Tax=Dictyostelium purpureum TaxID=5786 RepID=F0ZNR0_DICPU|nr:uncharacterized protein DICPUDRAFT_98229 [Dictyostelium purpureum]EGC34418.1 hypothetical protein DICPUDRAFT_98229 [Dictyostelium purpureum]|eukprot:XP_003289047.1 hypothetical protein DICPUDRAFT_98229 [Dictyostelium purpureum]
MKGKKSLTNFWKDPHPSTATGNTANNSNNGGNTNTNGSSPTKVKEGQVFGIPLNDIFKRYSTINNIPNIVWHITSNIRDNFMDVEGLFRIPGSNTTLQQLKKYYNEGKIQNKEDLNIKCADIHTQASLLKLFIRELPDPLFTFSLYDSFYKITLVESLKALLSQLPIAHYSLLKYLAELLREVATHSANNRRASTNLAIVFGPTVMRPQQEDIAKMIEDARHINGVFLLILDEYEYLFNNAELPSFVTSPNSGSPSNIKGILISPNSNSPSLDNSPVLTKQLSFGSTNPNRKAAKFLITNYNDFIVENSEDISNNNNSTIEINNSTVETTTIPNSITPQLDNNNNTQQQHTSKQQSQPNMQPNQPFLSTSPMMNNQNKFSILLPVNNKEGAPSSPNPYKTLSIVSPLPPASPRSSLTLEYDIHNGNNQNNNELIRNLIKKTCSMLFDKDLPNILTSSFEIVKDETFIPAFDTAHTSPNSADLGAQVSPRFLRSAGNDVSSSNSSPQLRSLLKNNINNNLNGLNNLPTLLGTLQQSQQQSSPQAQQNKNDFDTITNKNEESACIIQTNSTATIVASSAATPSLIAPNVPSSSSSSYSNPTTTSTSSVSSQQPPNHISPSHQQTLLDLNPLEQAFNHLEKIRKDSKRVSDINLMSIDDLNEEKSAIKKELRDFDTNFKKQYGQLPRKNDKEIMRPLYTRYREVKSLIDLKSPQLSNSSTPNSLSTSSNTTTPISLSSSSIKSNGHHNNYINNNNYNNNMNGSSSSISTISTISSLSNSQDLQQKQNSSSSSLISNNGASSNNSGFKSSSPPNSNYVSPYVSPSASFSSLSDLQNNQTPNNNNNSNNNNNNNNTNSSNNSQSNEKQLPTDLSKLSTNELKERYIKVKGEKRTLQIDLHRYQSDFTKKHGRKVQFVEDRVPVQTEYEKYKELKIELTLIEKLLGINPANPQQSQPQPQQQQIRK